MQAFEASTSRNRLEDKLLEALRFSAGFSPLSDHCSLCGGGTAYLVAALAAVPEPASIIIAGIAALAGLGVAWRRHRPRRA